jgi:hypothetical protein
MYLARKFPLFVALKIKLMKSSEAWNYFANELF